MVPLFFYSRGGQMSRKTPQILEKVQPQKEKRG